MDAVGVERTQLPGAKIVAVTGCGPQKSPVSRVDRRQSRAAVTACRKTVPRLRKCVPESASLNVRAYLDEVFGSLMSRLSVPSANGFGTGEPSVFEYVGTVVDSILRYNNIHFRTITVTVLKDSDAHMPEPLWYAFPNINDANSTGAGGCSVSCGDELQIFVSYLWYREYSAVNTGVPVLWPNGALVIEKYNLPEEDRRVSVMDATKIKCVVACDHLAQHIINEYSLRSEGENSASQIQNLTDLDGDIHDRWTKTGATLHSFLDLTVLLDKHDRAERNEKSPADIVWQSYGV